MWGCGHILSRVIREATGLGFTMCLYPRSDREERQGGWNTVGVECFTRHFMEETYKVASEQRGAGRCE